MNYSSIIELKFALKTKQSIYIVPGCNFSYPYHYYKSWFFSGRNEYFYKVVHGPAYDEFPKTNEPCFIYKKFKLRGAILNSVKLIEGEVSVTK